MVKTVKLPERPKPPDKAQITEDLKRASNEDVIFADLKIQSSPVPTNLSTEESYAELSSLDKSYDNPTVSEASQSQGDVNRTYRHVKRLIELQSELAKEPELLQQKYENLKDLGDNVSDCITDLKQAAENITKKS